VVCESDPTQTYTLYLPSKYTPERTWPVIFAFDPGGRGRNPVERYEAAAEQYGYIVAGSNTSRNGLPAGRAVQAMSGDVGARFNIDPKRMYTAGMSGGARVAMSIALNSPRVAGVFASSAAYPDGELRKTLPFPVFATAGTEDFNHLEMRQFDRELTTPHHLSIFEGGHIWLSSAMALEGVEWMEVQAMKAGLKPRDDNELDAILAKRIAAIAVARSDKDAFMALESLAADFKGLRDVSSFSTRAEALGKYKSVRDGIKKDRDEDNREQRTLDEVRALEGRLQALADHNDTLVDLRQRWQALSLQANAGADSEERRFARRVLNTLSATVESTDPEYLKIVAEYRLGRGGRAPQ
jgi:hypothetical protein